jgi:hypothetical protein
MTPTRSSAGSAPRTLRLESPKRSEAQQSRAARQGRAQRAAKRCLLTAARSEATPTTPGLIAPTIGLEKPAALSKAQKHRSRSRPT